MHCIRACAALALLLMFGCVPPSAPHSPTTPSSKAPSGGAESAAASSGGHYGAVTVKDSTGATETMRTTEVVGEHIPHNIVADETGDILDVVAEDAAHVSAEKGLMPLARVDASAGSTATAGDYATLNVTGTGELRTTAIVTSNALPTGAATEATSSTTLTELQAQSHAEDGAHVSADLGVMPLARVDASAGSTLTPGDYGTLNLTTSGELRTTAIVTSNALPTGAATEATLADIETDVDTLIARTPALGQAAMAASSPVVIASDQSAVPVSGTIAVTGVATEVTLADIEGDVDTLVARTAALGQAAMAASMPVTIASNQSAIAVTDNSGTLSIDDGGGTITVDGTLTLGAGTTNIGDVDVLSVVPGTAATNLGKAEDAAHVSGDTLVGAAAVRRDTATSGVSVDGDYATLNVNNVGRLWTTTVIDTALPAGTANIGDVDIASALPAGTNNIGDVDVVTLPALSAGTANIGDVDVATIAAGDNNIGNVDVLTMPALTLGAGTANIGDVDVVTLPALPAGTNNIGDVDVISIIPGTGATNLGKAEDAIHASGDTGSFSLAVRKDTASAAAADGDYTALIVDSTARLWTRTDVGAVEDAGHLNGDGGAVMLGRVSTGASSATLNDYATLNLTDTGELRVTDSALGQPEDSAHVSADTGIPLLTLRQSSASGSTGSDGDYQLLSTDSNGRLYAIATIDAALPTGSNFIGSINSIGDALPPGTNEIGAISGITSSTFSNSGSSVLKAEDAAHVSGDNGVMILGRVSTGASSATAGDYATLNLTTTGELRVNQPPPYLEVTAFSQVASNTSQFGDMIDVRGYQNVTVEFHWPNSGAAATGSIEVWGSLGSGSGFQVNTAGWASSLKTDSNETCTRTGADPPYTLSVNFTSVGEGLCQLSIGAPAYIRINWLRTGGGSAAGASGLTVRVYGAPG